MNDKYLTYDALELAQDDAFIQWVKNGDSPMPEEWDKWLGQHPEKREEMEEARLIVQSILIKEAPVSEERISLLWEKIDAATEERAVRAKVLQLRPYRWLGYAAAAALALLIAFFFLRPDGAVTIENGFGQVAQHILPDGSTVELNAGTTIRYEKATWAIARRVSLEGEAFFEVKKGTPFVVETPKGEVIVLGTSFNIKTFEGRFDVQCYTGQVQVSAEGKRELLTAGQMAHWAESDWQRATFDATNNPGWQRGRFEYHSTPLQEVFAEMERQFDIRIDAPDSILARTYTGSFERNALDSALYRVCWPMKLKSSRSGKAVIIQTEENAE